MKFTFARGRAIVVDGVKSAGEWDDASMGAIFGGAWMERARIRQARCAEFVF